MNVSEYVELRKKELDAFAADWLKNQEEEPEDWPESYPEVYDWREQEHAFFEMDGWQA